MKTNLLFLAFSFFTLFSCNHFPESPKIVGGGVGKSIGNPNFVLSLNSEFHYLNFRTEHDLSLFSTYYNEVKSQFFNFVNENFQEPINYSDILTSQSGPFSGINPFLGNGVLIEINDPFIKLVADEDPLCFLIYDAYNFQSLRFKIISEGIEVQNSTEIGFETYDPESFYLKDEEIQSILSPFGEYQAGPFVYKFINEEFILQWHELFIPNFNGIRSSYSFFDNWKSGSFEFSYGTLTTDPLLSLPRPPKVLSAFEFGIAVSCSAGFGVIQQQSPLRTYQFQNNSVGNYTSLQWDFGDGNFSNAVNPTHTYQAFGTYNVILTLYENSATCDVYTMELMVTGLCESRWDSYVNQDGLSVQFWNNQSFPGNGSQIVSYFWDFADGSTSSAQSITHQFPGSGAYNVCLTITTNSTPACSSTICKIIHVDNPPPKNCCKSAQSIEDQNVIVITDSPNYGYKRCVWLINIPPGVLYHRSGSSVRFYKKNGNGNWKKEKARSLRAYIIGSVSIDNCENWEGVGLNDVKLNVNSVSISAGRAAWIKTNLSGLAGYCSITDNRLTNSPITSSDLLILTTDKCD